MSLWSGIKHRAKVTSPALYDALLKAGTSKIARTIRGAPSALHDEWLLKRNAPDLYVDLVERNGVGAMFSDVAQILHYADELGHTPHIRFLNPLYAPSRERPTDWQSLFLTSTLPPSDAAHTRAIPLKQNLRRHLDRRVSSLSIQRAHDLFFSAFSFDVKLTNSVEAVVKAKEIGVKTIGVHFRGTDKSLEAPRLKWEEIRRVLDTKISHFDNVLVATDEPEFLEYMHGAYGQDLVRDLDCAHIFHGSQPAHLSNADGPEKAHEALLTMISLSKCGLLIRGSSHLSAWSKIINPQLEVIMLERPFSKFPFPDGLIWRESAKATD